MLEGLAHQHYHLETVGDNTPSPAAAQTFSTVICAQGCSRKTFALVLFLAQLRAVGALGHHLHRRQAKMDLSPRFLSLAHWHPTSK